jgi:hypothetical protein
MPNPVHLVNTKARVVRGKMGLGENGSFCGAFKYSDKTKYQNGKKMLKWYQIVRNCRKHESSKTL